MAQLINAILDAAQQRLDTAYFGLTDMREQGHERFQSGLMNAVVFGRMVTFQMQNLNGKAHGWEEWYKVRQEKMKADPLMRYFHDLRTSIEKQAKTLNVAMSARIHSFNDGTMARFQPAPPGAKALVIGSAKHSGASGWLVPGVDGSEELYVVDLPSDIGEVWMNLVDAPSGYEHEPTDVLVVRYLNNLQTLLSEAKATFSR